MIIGYILETLSFGVNWVFGVKRKEKMLIIALVFGLCHVEVWDRVGLGEKMMFHFDVHLRCLLHMSRNEQANGQTDLELRGMSGLDVQI